VYVMSGILKIKSVGMICGCKGKLQMCRCKYWPATCLEDQIQKVLLYYVGSDLYTLTSKNLKKPLNVIT